MQKIEQIEHVLTVMQEHDRNGFWLEWLEEMKAGESSFDYAYVIETLQAWYDDSKDELYLKLVSTLQT